MNQFYEYPKAIELNVRRDDITVESITSVMKPTLTKRFFFYQGFQLTFEEVSMACGSSLTLTNDIKDSMVASPNYPSAPPPYAECEWVITAPTGHAIRLDFTANSDSPRLEIWQLSCWSVFHSFVNSKWLKDVGDRQGRGVLFFVLLAHLPRSFRNNHMQLWLIDVSLFKAEMFGRRVITTRKESLCSTDRYRNTNDVDL